MASRRRTSIRAFGALALVASSCVLPAAELVAEATDADACSSCAEQQCASQYDSCYSQSACETLVNCALQCPSGDADCTTACALGSPDGVTAATELIDCAVGACPEDCGSLAM